MDAFPDRKTHKSDRTLPIRLAPHFFRDEDPDTKTLSKETQMSNVDLQARKVEP